MIFRAAILSSPTSSPIEGDQLIITSYSSSHPKFEFGTSSKFQQLFITDDDDPDFEIVEKTKTKQNAVLTSLHKKAARFKWIIDHYV